MLAGKTVRAGVMFWFFVIPQTFLLLTLVADIVNNEAFYQNSIPLFVVIDKPFMPLFVV